MPYSTVIIYWHWKLTTCLKCMYTLSSLLCVIITQHAQKAFFYGELINLKGAHYVGKAKNPLFNAPFQSPLSSKRWDVNLTSRNIASPIILLSIWPRKTYLWYIFVHNTQVHFSYIKEGAYVRYKIIKVIKGITYETSKRPLTKTESQKSGIRGWIKMFDIADIFTCVAICIVTPIFDTGKGDQSSSLRDGTVRIWPHEATHLYDVVYGCKWDENFRKYRPKSDGSDRKIDTRKKTVV